MGIGGGGGVGVAKAASLGRKVFAKVDDNRDGVIAPRELKASGVIHKMGLGAPGESEKQWMARVDANKDGVLSRHEAEAAFAAAAHGKAGAAIAAMLMTEGMAAFPYTQEAEEEDPAETSPDAAPQQLSPGPVTVQVQQPLKAYAALDRLAQDQSQTALSLAT